MILHEVDILRSVFAKSILFVHLFFWVTKYEKKCENDFLFLKKVWLKEISGKDDFEKSVYEYFMTFKSLEKFSLNISKLFKYLEI